MTKCPHCEKVISRVNIEELDGYVAGRPAFRTVSYNCPLCFTSISMQIDPIAIKTSTIAELKRR